MLASLDERFSSLFRRWTRLNREVWEQEITLGQYALLRFLGEHPQAMVSEAATALGLAPSSITALADRLAESGMIVRTRGTSDRRSVSCMLTDAGEEFLRAARLRRSRMLERLLAGVPRAKLDCLLEVLDHIVGSGD